MSAKKYKVDILGTKGEGPQEVLYSYLCVDNHVTCTAPETPWAFDDGIVKDDPSKPLFPSDGMKFMEALHIAYSGSMTRATKPVLI